MQRHSWLLAAPFLLVLACEKAPDLSTPDKAASAFVDAVNSGSEKAFLKVAGKDAVSRAEAHCENFKKQPEPKKPEHDPFGLQTAFYQLELSQRGQACSEIGKNLSKFLETVADAERKLSVKSIGEPKTEKNETTVTVQLSGPNPDQRAQDELVLIQDSEKRWIATRGTRDVPIANTTFSMPMTATWVTEKDLGRTLGAAK